MVTDFIVLGKWDLLSISLNNVTILILSDSADKVTEQKARGNIMHPVISIGKQNFASLRENNCFYIDKSDLIREWWESQDEITLITRPRRFGKTLNMSMLNYFFSNLYTDKKTLFEDLSVWKRTMVSSDDYKSGNNCNVLEFI